MRGPVAILEFSLIRVENLSSSIEGATGDKRETRTFLMRTSFLTALNVWPFAWMPLTVAAESLGGSSSECRPPWPTLPFWRGHGVIGLVDPSA